MERRIATACLECRSLLRASRKQYAPTVTGALRSGPQSQRASLTTHASSSRARPPIPRRTFNSSTRRVIAAATSQSTGSHGQQGWNPEREDLDALHARVEELGDLALKPKDVLLPPEQRILYILEKFETFAKRLLAEKEPRPIRANTHAKANQKQTAASALLGSVDDRRRPSVISRQSLLNELSYKAEEILRHPNTFITAAILKHYVQLQSLLNQPSSLPDIFDLYTSKDIPKESGGHVTYSKSSPNHINLAIDAKTANLALDTAIHSRNLSLAIDVIVTSFATTSYKRAKTVRQAGIPAVGLGLAPFAVYTLSSNLSVLQNTMDPSLATGVAFAGIMTYVAAVSTMGYVVVTTANDQMDRVTWASGVPLWERWVREDERAAIDRVAGAWGFKDVSKRGDEDGEDWMALKEWIGMRGMVLDRVSLMEGME